jgi:hypothetical protein
VRVKNGLEQVHFQAMMFFSHVLLTTAQGGVQPDCLAHSSAPRLVTEWGASKGQPGRQILDRKVDSRNRNWTKTLLKIVIDGGFKKELSARLSKGETYADEISYQRLGSVFASWNHCSRLRTARKSGEKRGGQTTAGAT